MSTKTLTKKTSLFSDLNADGTIFTINFDFDSADQQAILTQLQAGGYTLLGYKGATGPNQVSAGLPTWFAEPFKEVFGGVHINYEPMYKVYVYNEASIGANTTIQMEAMSPAIPLGTAVTFDENGSFTTVANGAPAGIITVLNNRPADTTAVTVGLAAYVNGNYQPFCAFTSQPLGSVSMEPIENVLLFAAQTNLVSGSVVANAAAPGCTFEFDASSINYDLLMIDNTYGITSTATGLPVTETPSGANLNQLLNTPS